MMKEMNQMFIEQFELELSPIIQKIKNWDGDPSKLNDLRTVVKADSARVLKSVIDDLKREFPNFSIDSLDPEKLLEAMGRSSTNDSEDNLKALVFLMESSLCK